MAEGVVNASAHDEAQNYGDKVCHLILFSFHHNLKEKHTRGHSPWTTADHTPTYGLFQLFFFFFYLESKPNVCVCVCVFV